jgi:hypothetical protein
VLALRGRHSGGLGGSDAATQYGAGEAAGGGLNGEWSMVNGQWPMLVKTR